MVPTPVSKCWCKLWISKTFWDCNRALYKQVPQAPPLVWIIIPSKPWANPEGWYNVTIHILIREAHHFTAVLKGSIAVALIRNSTATPCLLSILIPGLTQVNLSFLRVLCIFARPLVALPPEEFPTSSFLDSLSNLIQGPHRFWSPWMIPSCPSSMSPWTSNRLDKATPTRIWNASLGKVVVRLHRSHRVFPPGCLNNCTVVNLCEGWLAWRLLKLGTRHSLCTRPFHSKTNAKKITALTQFQVAIHIARGGSGLCESVHSSAMHAIVIRWAVVAVRRA